MTNTLTQIPVDITPSTAALQPQGRMMRYLPWILLALVSIALVTVILPRPEPIAPPPLPVPAQKLQIDGEQSGGIGENTWVYRDPITERITAVVTAIRPYNEEEVWCRIRVNGTIVAEEHALNGSTAICVWINDLPLIT